MKYIVHTRFKTKAICGDVNLPAMTECELYGSMLTHDGKSLCMIRSENSHKHFARDDDGNGMRRGALTTAIIKTLTNADADWNKVLADTLCQKYKRPEHPDTWLWSHEFYNANIEDLEYIAELVGAHC